ARPAPRNRKPDSGEEQSNQHRDACGNRDSQTQRPGQHHRLNAAEKERQPETDFAHQTLRALVVPQPFNQKRQHREQNQQRGGKTESEKDARDSRHEAIGLTVDVPVNWNDLRQLRQNPERCAEAERENQPGSSVEEQRILSWSHSALLSFFLKN